MGKVALTPEDAKPTQQMRKFAKLVAKGDITLVEAYRRCYSVGKSQPRTVGSKASALRKHPWVDAEIQRLQQPEEDDIRITANQKRMYLEQVINAGLKKIYDRQGNEVLADGRGVIAAVAELNKMDGDLAAQKTEATHKHSFDSLSDDQLDARINALLGQG